MKLSRRANSGGICSCRLFALLAGCGVLPLLVLAATPQWWSQRGVLVTNAAPADFAPANQGQLRNLAKAAVAEMDEKLLGGAGDEVHNALNAWTTSNSQRNDYAPANLGQVKSVAKLIYD